MTLKSTPSDNAGNPDAAAPASHNHAFTAQNATAPWARLLILLATRMPPRLHWGWVRARPGACFFSALNTSTGRGIGGISLALALGQLLSLVYATRAAVVMGFCWHRAPLLRPDPHRSPLFPRKSVLYG